MSDIYDIAECIVFCTRSSLIIPDTFPEGVPAHKFDLGARVSWQPSPSQDFGVITGMEYAPTPDLDGWGWRYTVWLDARSPSAQWIPFDSVWEEDLMVLPTDPMEDGKEASEP